MSDTRQPLWSVPFALAILTNLLIGTVFMGLMTSIALYAAARFQAAEGSAGLAAGAFVIGAAASRVLLSRFIDHVGRRRMMLIGLTVFALVSALHFVASGLVALIVVRFVHGAALGVAHTALTTAVMAMIPPRRRAEGTGYYGVANALVTAIGPLVAVLVTGTDPADGTPLFTFATICGAAGLVAGLLVRTTEVTPRPPAGQAWWRYRLSDVTEPTVLPIAGIALILGCAFSGVMVFLTTYTRERGMEDVAGAYFTVYALVVVVTRLVLGRVQDRRGDNVVVYPLLAAFAGGLLLLAAAPSGAVLIVSAILLGAGFGGLITASQAIAINVAPTHRVPMAVSTFFIGLDLGTGLGPMLMGLIAGLVGFSGMYAALAGLIAVTAALYHWAHGSRRHRPD